jgi:hypothetical protein
VSDTPSAPAPAPPPSRGFLPWWLWWLPGAVLGWAAALTAFAVVQKHLSAEPTHRAEALVQLPPDEPDAKRRHRAFELRSRELVARTLAEPAVALLPSVRSGPDPVADVAARLATAEVAPDVLSVTLTGHDPDDPRVILDHLVKRFVDDATAADRRTRDDERKKLEQLSEAMRVEIEAAEKNIELIGRANGTTGGEDNAHRLALLQQRHIGADTEYTRAGREIIKMEAEIAVLKRRAENKGAAPVPDPKRIDELATAIEIKKEEREKLKTERDALQKLIAGGVVGGLDIQRMQQSLNPQREQWHKIEVRLTELRVTERLRPQIVIRSEATVAPTTTRGERAATVGIPTAIAFAAGFVLATGFSLVGLVFRVLRRAA